MRSCLPRAHLPPMSRCWRARAALPMVVGLGPLSWDERPPALALVDGDAGTVIFDPEPETRRLFEHRMSGRECCTRHRRRRSRQACLHGAMAGGSRSFSISPHPKISRALIPRSATASALCAPNSCSRPPMACRTRKPNMRSIGAFSIGRREGRLRSARSMPAATSRLPG